MELQTYLTAEGTENLSGDGIILQEYGYLAYLPALHARGAIAVDNERQKFRRLA